MKVHLEGHHGKLVGNFQLYRVIIEGVRVVGVGGDGNWDDVTMTWDCRGDSRASFEKSRHVFVAAIAQRSRG